MDTNNHKYLNPKNKDKKSIGSTTIELKFEVPNEKFDEFATHLSAIKKLLEK